MKGRARGLDARDALVFGALVVAALAWAAGVERRIDLSVADEARYLEQGLDLARRLPSPQWAPLYSAWYFALSFVRPDPSQLHDLSYGALTAGVPLLLYALLRQSGIPAALAGAVAGLHLISSPNVDVWPYQSRFASVLLLTGLLAGGAARTRHGRWLAPSIALFAIAYVRPEYMLAFAGLSGVAILAAAWSWWRERRLPAVRVLAAPALFAAVAAAVVIQVGLPLSGGRSGLAFAQHFTLNHRDASGGGISYEVEYVDLMERTFGGMVGLPAAFAANPDAVRWHVATNARRAGPRLLDAISFLRPSPRVVTPQVAGLLPWIAGATVLLAAMLHAVGAIGGRRGLGVAGGLRRTRAGTAGPASGGGLALPLALMGAVALAVVPSILLVYPRAHYLELFGLLVTILCAHMVASAPLPQSGRLGTRARRALGWAFAVGVAALLLALARDGGGRGTWLRAPDPPAPALRYRRAVDFLRTLAPDRPLRLLAPVVSDSGPEVYLAPRVVAVPLSPRMPRGSFRRYAERHGIDVVLWPETFARFPSYRADQEFQDLVAAPAALGFESVPLPSIGPPLRVLVRRELLGQLEVGRKEPSRSASGLESSSVPPPTRQRTARSARGPLPGDRSAR